MSKSEPTSQQQKIAVAKIQGPWGLKGQVKCALYDPASQVLLKTRLVFLKAGFSFRELKVLESRRQGEGILLSVEGIKSPEEAQQLRGQEIFIERRDLPAKKEGEFFIFELQDLKVYDTQGVFLGKVAAIETYGASEILVVRDADKNSEHLIPLIPGTLRQVSLSEQKIVIEMMEGLF